MLSCMVLYAQETKTHTVQPGETLARIAQMYGVTESELLEANPTARNYFFTGLRLVIPIKDDAQYNHSGELPSKQEVDAQRNAIELANESENSNVVENDVSAGGLTLGLVFPSEDSGRDASGFQIQLDGSRFFTPSIYGGWGLGYRTEKYSASYGGADAKIRTHEIYIPLRVGYRFNLDKSIHLDFFTGPKLNYILSCNQKVSYGGESEKINLKKEKGFKSFYLDWLIGTRLTFGIIGISASYGFGLTDKMYKGEKANYFSVGLSFGY